LQAECEAMEILGGIAGPGNQEACMKVTAWLKAGCRVDFLRRPLANKVGGDAVEQLSPAEKEKCSRELLRAVQRADQSNVTALLPSVGKGLAKVLVESSAGSKALVTEAGNELREAYHTSVQEGSAELAALMRSDDGLQTYDAGKAHCDTLVELVDLYTTRGFQESPTAVWLEKCEALQAGIHAFEQKTNEFLLQKNDQFYSDTVNQIKAVRVTCLTADLLTSFSDPRYAKDKLALRACMLKAQAKSRDWEILPDMLNEHVLAKYRAALKMR